jgi:hypothetical protein
MEEASFRPGYPKLERPDRIPDGVPHVKVHLFVLATAVTGIDHH